MLIATFALLTYGMFCLQLSCCCEPGQALSCEHVLPQAVRDQLKKLAVGGPKEEKEKAYEVSDSDDEDFETAEER